MRRFQLVIVVMVALSLFVAACGDDDTSSDEGADSTTSSTGEGGEPGCAEAEGAVVGFSEPLPDPNFQIIEQVITDELEKVGATLEAVNANLDPGKQVSDITTLHQQGIDALIVNPVDPNAVQAPIADVMADGIPVIAEDTEVGGPYTSSVQSDSGAAAEMGAELLKEKVGDGQVAVAVGPPFAEILERSRKAFEAKAEEIGLNVVDTQTNMAITPDAARGFAETWKQEYGEELAGIWTFNDVSAVGVASIFDDSFQPTLVSINGQPDAVPLVEAGKITATYDLQTDWAGRALAYAAIEAICGNELPEQIWIGAKLIDESNAAEYVPPAERAEESLPVELEERDGRTFVKGS